MRRPEQVLRCSNGFYPGHFLHPERGHCCNAKSSTKPSNRTPRIRVPYLENPMSATAQPTSPHVMNTYGRLPIALSHGQGCRVWDTAGKAYIDGLGGIAVNTLGHNHPELVPALQDQIAKLIHSSNYYHVPGQELLAAKLVELSGLTNVFFCNTGLEA